VPSITPGIIIAHVKEVRKAKVATNQLNPIPILNFLNAFLTPKKQSKERWIRITWF
jgi:hypothetical protein